MLKVIILIVIGILIPACATPRVLVKDCKEAGPDLKNCELVQKL